jgi:hypothetical protein
VHRLTRKEGQKWKQLKKSKIYSLFQSFRGSERK